MSEVSDDLRARVQAAVGVRVRSLAPVGGGIICQPHRAVLDDGRAVFVKTRTDAPAGFFELEAAGLAWLAAASERGGVPIARVLAAAPDLLALEWVPTVAASAPAATAFGRALAFTHNAGAARFGSAVDGFIGSQPLPAGRAGDSWPEFFASARLMPYLDMARAAHAIDPADADTVERLAARLPELGERPELAEASGALEPPARVHGDLWAGNVLWTRRSAVLVDPAAHGGHRLFDLAMLDLFGLPFLDAAVAGYAAAAAESGRALPAGWRRFLPVHQLFPLLVHAVHFGGRYGPAAGVMARRALALLPD